MPKRIYVGKNGRSSFSFGVERTLEGFQEPLVGFAKFPKVERNLRKIGVSPAGVQQVLNGKLVTSSADRQSLARVLPAIFDTVDLLGLDMSGVMSG